MKSFFQYLKIFAFICLAFNSSRTKEKERPIEVAEAPQTSDAIKVDVIVPEHGMADPHAWVQNDTVYIICGQDESWEGNGSFRMDRWEVWSSADLKNWNYHSDILPSQTYIADQPNCWAGDICERDGKYYWFFSNRNINTGVVVADEITGEYKNLLRKPLLQEGIVPAHPYDPEIYIEDDVLIQDENGNKLGTEDKSTLFRRNDWYYLVYGNRYSMSKNLYGQLMRFAISSNDETFKTSPV